MYGVVSFVTRSLYPLETGARFPLSRRVGGRTRANLEEVEKIKLLNLQGLELCLHTDCTIPVSKIGLHVF
jgi:hypothetical protein